MHPSRVVGRTSTKKTLSTRWKDQAQTPPLRPPQRPCAAVPLSAAEIREVPIVELFGLVHEEAYRRLTLTHHSDKSGDADAFNELTQRYEEACEPGVLTIYKIFRASRAPKRATSAPAPKPAPPASKPAPAPKPAPLQSQHQAGAAKAGTRS